MKLLVIGAGGHAKVVVDAALRAGHVIAGIVDVDPGCAEVLGHTVSGSSDEISADHFIVAIGDNRTRALRYEEHRAAGLTPSSVIHPSAVIAPSAHIGAGTFVAAGVIVNPDAVVGSDVILNTGCVIEHDVAIGDHAHVGPNASVCGAVRVGEGALIGVGASVRPGTRIGSWCTVGAGAAVVSDQPPGIVCAGVPARVIPAPEDV